MNTLVIDKNRWYRGHGSDVSRLLRNDGQMCCLGFWCKMHGAEDEDILGRFYPPGARMLPNGSFSDEPNSDEWFIEEDSGERASIDGTIAFINDCPDIDDEERIAKLRPLFRKYLDTELEFTE